MTVPQEDYEQFREKMAPEITGPVHERMSVGQNFWNHSVYDLRKLRRTMANRS